MRTLAPFVAAAALAGCSQQAPDCAALGVTGAWVRAAPPGADIAAGYFSANNPGPDEVVISGVSSPGFARAAMHRSVEADGQVRMEPLAEAPVPPGASVAFAPGGRHLMLFAPKTELAVGSKVRLRLACGSGEVAFTAAVRVRAPSGGHAHH